MAFTGRNKDGQRKAMFARMSTPSQRRNIKPLMIKRKVLTGKTPKQMFDFHKKRQTQLVIQWGKLKDKKNKTKKDIQKMRDIDREINEEQKILSFMNRRYKFLPFTIR